MKPIELKFNSSTIVYFWPFDGYDENESYHVIFYEKKDGKWIESMNEHLKFQPYHWFSFFRRFFHEMKVQLITFDEEFGTRVIAEDWFDPKGKDVKISIDTEDRHEAFVWIEQALEFGKKWDCRISIECPREIAERAIPIYVDVDFSTEPKDFYATYNIGRYDILVEGIYKYGAQVQSKGWVNGGHKFFRSFSNPRDWKTLHSEQIARDILGLSDTQAWNQRYVDAEWFINTLQIKDDKFEIKKDEI
jgi:hypothetical protein